MPDEGSVLEMDGDALLAQHIVRLEHPDGAGQVYVLGTAHVSPLAAKEARELILSTRPDVVMVELDAVRYAAITRNADSSPATAAQNLLAKADSVPKVLSLVWAGGAGSWVGACGYALAGTFLDTQPGGEFVAALAAAREVGAVVVLGDRSAEVTFSRLRARLLALRASLPPDAAPSDIQKRVPRSESEVGDSFARLGCHLPHSVLPAAKRVIAAAAAGRAVNPADLAVARACFLTVVEASRDAAMGGAGDAPPDAPQGAGDAGAARAKSVLPDWRQLKTIGGPQLDVVYRTVVAERDLILARSLQMAAAPVVVGVVGAGHIPGIKSVWSTARSPSSFAAAEEYEKPFPADAPPPRTRAERVARSAVGATAIALSVRYFPRGSLRFAGALSGMTLVWAAGCAAGVRVLEGGVASVEAASAALRQGAPPGQGGLGGASFAAGNGGAAVADPDFETRR